MSPFTLKVTLPPGINAISKLPALIQANVFQALKQGMMVAEQISQTKYLTGPRPEKLGVVTGLLRSSVKSGAYLGGDPGTFATGVLSANTEYARIHEYGGTTRPHRIEAKNVRNLKFFWKKKGIWFLGPRVNHPGSKIPARPYLTPAIEDSLPVIADMIQASIDRAFKEF